MKKITKFFAAMALIVLGTAASAQADGAAINDAFFPEGNMSTPNAPYVLYQDTYGDGAPREGSIRMYFDIPSELLALNAENATLGIEEFNEKYGTPILGDYHESLATEIQIDTKFDDGAWLSESGNWDVLDYGASIDPSNLCYRTAVGRYIDDTDKLFDFEQSWFVYNDPTDPRNEFLQPYLKSFKDEYDTDCYQLDLENHTFTFRVRFVVYTNNWQAFDEDAEVYWCISDWSPEVSIGKNGTQETLEKPDKVEAPVLSDFKLIKTEENGVEAQYYVEFGEYTYNSIKYFSAIENFFEPFYIESQIRVDGGEWVDTYTANAASLAGGYRSTGSGDVEITMDSQVEIRIRIVCSAMDETASEWSNIVGNTAEDEILPTPEVTVEETTPTPTTEATVAPEKEKEPEKDKCKVCGICPVQPLGICLFIWLVIIIVVIVVVIIVVKKMNDKDDKKDNKK